MIGRREFLIGSAASVGVLVGAGCNKKPEHDRATFAGSLNQVQSPPWVSSDQILNLLGQMKDVTVLVERYLNPQYARRAAFLDQFANPSNLNELDLIRARREISDITTPPLPLAYYTGPKFRGAHYNYELPEIESWRLELGQATDIPQVFEISFKYDGNKEPVYTRIDTGFINTKAIPDLSGFEGLIEPSIEPEDIDLDALARTVYQLPAALSLEEGDYEIGGAYDDGRDTIRGRSVQGQIFYPGNKAEIRFSLTDRGESTLEVFTNKPDSVQSSGKEPSYLH